MVHTIIQILTQNNVLSHQNQGITVAKVHSSNEGITLARDILYQIIDRQTMLYLSGGSLKSLYELLAKEEKLMPAGVGLVDERYGEKFWENSNEKMIRETQFLRYLHARDIPFHPILRHCEEERRSNPRHDEIAAQTLFARNDECRQKTAELYDQKFRELNNYFPKSVGLLGIGPDGHTSSLAPNRPDFTNPMFSNAQKHMFVSEFNDPNSHYKERIGMTFLGLSVLDLLIVPAFGVGKRESLEKMFQDGPEEEIPARFFKRKEIAPRTLLITDLSI